MGRSWFWIHGHMHDSQRYLVNGTEVILNPRGYPLFSGGFENKLFDPALQIDPQAACGGRGGHGLCGLGPQAHCEPVGRTLEREFGAGQIKPRRCCTFVRWQADLQLLERQGQIQRRHFRPAGPAGPAAGSTRPAQRTESALPAQRQLPGAGRLDVGQGPGNRRTHQRQIAQPARPGQRGGGVAEGEPDIAVAGGRGEIHIALQPGARQRQVPACLGATGRVHIPAPALQPGVECIDVQLGQVQGAGRGGRAGSGPATPGLHLAQSQRIGGAAGRLPAGRLDRQLPVDPVAATGACGVGDVMKLKDELGFGAAGAAVDAAGVSAAERVIVSRVALIQWGLGLGPMGSKRG